MDIMVICLKVWKNVLRNWRKTYRRWLCLFIQIVEWKSEHNGVMKNARWYQETFNGFLWGCWKKKLEDNEKFFDIMKKVSLGLVELIYKRYEKDFAKVYSYTKLYVDYLTVVVNVTWNTTIDIWPWNNSLPEHFCDE